MNYGLEEILWLLVLFDSIISNIIIWFFPKWYNKKFKGMTKYFPATKGWSLLYLILVIWIVVRFIGPAAGWWIPADIR